jgi:hypothetical protein
LKTVLLRSRDGAKDEVMIFPTENSIEVREFRPGQPYDSGTLYMSLQDNGDGYVLSDSRTERTLAYCEAEYIAELVLTAMKRDKDRGSWAYRMELP